MRKDRLGGLLGQTIGLRPTLFVAVGGGLLSGLWLLFSPVRRLRDYPAPAAEPVEAAALSD